MDWFNDWPVMSREWCAELVQWYYCKHRSKIKWQSVWIRLQRMIPRWYQLVPKRVFVAAHVFVQLPTCASYRVSARMKTSPDLGLWATGFRCVGENWLSTGCEGKKYDPDRIYNNLITLYPCHGLMLMLSLKLYLAISKSLQICADQIK